MKDYDRVLLWSEELAGSHCLPTSPEQCAELNLRQRLLRTCVQYGGVGVSAPQIGVNLQACLVNYEDRTILLINPEVLESGTVVSPILEGCLSIPMCRGGRSKAKTYEGGKVSRPDTIKVQYLDDRGDTVVEVFTDYIAHIVGHEIDHLRGRFYIDHLDSLHRDMVMRKFRKFKRHYEVA